jgi:hypothetical protein
MYYRSFGIIDSENKLFTVKWYPNKVIKQDSFDLKSLIHNRNDFNRSKYSVDLLNYSNDMSCYIFQDNTTFLNPSNIKENYLVYSDKGMKTIINNDIKYGTIFHISEGEGLDGLISNDEELIQYDSSSGHQCRNCGEYFENGSCMCEVPNGSLYCQECYDENYTNCYTCEDTIRVSRSYYDEESNETYCEECYNRLDNEESNNWQITTPFNYTSNENGAETMANNFTSGIPRTGAWNTVISNT